MRKKAVNMKRVAAAAPACASSSANKGDKVAPSTDYLKHIVYRTSSFSDK